MVGPEEAIWLIAIEIVEELELVTVVVGEVGCSLPVTQT
jgi:hypothetical protein